MKKLLIIVPHLSTGGLPQVTLNKIKLLEDDFEIKLVEYDILALVFNVQRNKILDILGGKNFHTLDSSNRLGSLKKIVKEFKPNVGLF